MRKVWRCSDISLLIFVGDVAERFKEAVLKTGDGSTVYEFESHRFRHEETLAQLDRATAF